MRLILNLLAVYMTCVLAQRNVMQHYENTDTEMQLLRALMNSGAMNKGYNYNARADDDPFVSSDYPANGPYYTRPRYEPDYDNTNPEYNTYYYGEDMNGNRGFFKKIGRGIKKALAKIGPIGPIGVSIPFK